MPKRIRTPDDVVLFHLPMEEPLGVLSLWSPHRMRDEKRQIFDCAAQMFWYVAFIHLGRNDLASAAFLAQTSKGMKTHMRQIKDKLEDPVVIAQLRPILCGVLRAKLAQYPEIKPVLESTRPKRIGFAEQGDTFLGLGRSADLADNVALWKTNLLGECWMTVRDEA